MKMESSLSCVLLLLCGLWTSVCPVPLAINKTVGSDVTLVTKYTGDPSEINWKVNGNKLVDMELKPQVDIHFYRLQDRATISQINGNLTIRNLTKGDSGVYKAEALVNNVIQETEIKLTVLDKNIRAIFTSSIGPPNISGTSATKGLSFSSSPGPPKNKKTNSHTEGPSARSTIHPIIIKQAGMPASIRALIIVVAILVVVVFAGCLSWWVYREKKRKQSYKTKDPCTNTLLDEVKSGETESGNDVKSEMKGSFLDAPEIGETESGNDVKSEMKGSFLDAPEIEETEEGNDGKSEEKSSSLDAPGTEETEAGNDGKSEVKRSSLDSSGTEETEAENDGKSEVKRSSLDAPGTETNVGNNMQPEEKRSSLDAPGPEETEVRDNVQPEEDEPVTVL